MVIHLRVPLPSHRGPQSHDFCRSSLGLLSSSHSSRDCFRPGLKPASSLLAALVRPVLSAPGFTCPFCGCCIQLCSGTHSELTHKLPTGEKISRLWSRHFTNVRDTDEEIYLPLVPQRDVPKMYFKWVLRWSRSKQDVSPLCLAGNPSLHCLSTIPVLFSPTLNPALSLDHMPE